MQRRPRRGGNDCRTPIPCTRPPIALQSPAVTPDHTPHSSGVDLEQERAIAHSGALARWAFSCASHPWRVIGSAIGAIVLLFALVAAFGGKLVDEFRVPGTDFQKASDLLDAKFGAQKGAALRFVLAAPEGEHIDTPARRAAVTKMIA